VIGKTVNEMLDNVSARPVSSHWHLPGLKLEAVFADEIFLAVCTAFAAAVKRYTPKHSDEVTRNLNSPPESAGNKQLL
jgi:hypothetical protein